MRGHKCVINKQRRSNNRRNNFSSNRSVDLWINLPCSTTEFTSFREFEKLLNNDYLLLHFAYIVNCFLMHDIIHIVYTVCTVCTITIV